LTRCRNLAILYCEQEKYAQGELMFQEALTIQRKTAVPAYPLTQTLLKKRTPRRHMLDVFGQCKVSQKVA